jgi:hypothetical protein
MADLGAIGDPRQLKSPPGLSRRIHRYAFSPCACGPRAWPTLPGGHLLIVVG